MISVEPAIPRPSARQPVRTGKRLAWTAPLGWGVCGFALLCYAAGPIVGRSSLLGTIVAGLAIAALSPLFSRVGRGFADLEIAGLLRLSLGVKLLATLPRFEMREDSVDYHRIGQRLAESFRRLDFTVDTGREIPGTGSVRYVTGLVEVFTFGDEFSTFVIFSLFGFLGLLGFLLAFRAGLPDIDPKRYAVLLLFWPSLVYWPSSIGKESLMLLSLGVIAYGAARLMQGEFRAFGPTAIGLLGAGLIRPHVALIAVTALIIALVLRAPGRGMLGNFGRFSLIGLLLVGGSVASDAVESLLDIDGLNPSGLSAALDMVNSRSSQGGSFFTAARIDGPSEYPWGFVTVLFRPLPHEASSMAMIATSVEAIVLAALVLAAVPRLIAGARSIREEAFVAYAVGFTLVFVYLFSAIGNFGILVRQRVMTLPLVLVAVALPTAKQRVRERRRQDQPAPAIDIRQPRSEMMS
ncbi:MAG: hypothetical protein DHS20C19_24330 [Acidimicrobiales bacterium]|nr:MAG: hypothetical protein DHS20C19_24330 [Acidimicrobiales bacterium]